MKKQLCLLISVCILLLPVFSLAEAVVETASVVRQVIPTPTPSEEPVKSSGDQINLLWKIPFGIGIDDFYEFATEATSFNFEIKYDSLNVPREVILGHYDTDAGYKIGSYLVRSVSAKFYELVYEAEKGTYSYPPNQKEALNRIYIDWNIPDASEMDYVTAQYCGIVYTIQQQFGAPTSCFFLITNSKKETYHCTMELPEVYLDFTDVIKALQNNEDHISVQTVFNNIRVSFNAFRRFNGYEYFVTAEFLSEPCDISKLDIQPIYNYDDIADTRLTQGVGF